MNCHIKGEGHGYGLNGICKFCGDKMSASYDVKGYVDVRIKIDDVFNASQSASPADIAELVKIRIETSIGSCEIKGHLLQIKEIG